MAKLRDIPRLTTEFYELAREYLLQETVGPAKRLGHFAGFSLGAAVLWGLAVVLLAVAGLRALYDVLPDSPYWEALSYVIAFVVLVAFIGILVKFAPERGVYDQPAEQPEGSDV